MSNRTEAVRHAGVVVPESRQKGSAGHWWAVAALSLAGIITGIDVTVVATALPTLSMKLGASTDQLQWIVDAYLLALSGLVLPAGVLGDRYGRRRVLALGLLVFGVASAAASYMTSAQGLIALRAVMGLGAAPVAVLIYAILPSMFSGTERLRAVAVTSASTFVGLSIGPLVGGWLLDRYDWQSIFLINPPVVALALVGVWFLVPESSDPRAPRLDWTGAVLSIAGVTALVYGIIEQPMNGWFSSPVLAGMGGGGVLLAIFVAHQLRARSPLVDLALFRQPRFGWSAVALATALFSVGGVLFALTPYFQIVQGYDAQQTGLNLLPLVAGLVVAAGVSNLLVPRLGAKKTIAPGLLIATAGALLLSRTGADSGFALIATGQAILGLGLGLAGVTVGDTVLGELSPRETGAGTALIRTAQYVAMSFGVAILGSTLNGAYQTGVAPHLIGLPAQIQAAATASIAGAQSLAPHTFAAARTSYATGLSNVTLLSAAVLAAGAVLVLAFLPGRAGQTAEERVQAQADGASLETGTREYERDAALPA